ncbi:tRNA pseudouridine(38-40) synthase TruA [Micrococcus sp.]|uniref:tRNA pseudouridine(38-40) synthase TruA n=1 Tax=Micrococcus sp. TaxID=1271 RepID=UPI002A913EC9|nr:tRNA pseudouridine(38-40) synthase TruA [Micrococcus sp.]MDY6055852.1 tRNA pseudouridine(38-40) synthase TruA [Micrococcus sp.]
MSAPTPPEATTSAHPGNAASPEGAVRVRLDLAYDGSGFRGWAAQPGLPTVQGALEEALARIVRRPVPTVVAGRTDAGVHARGQVVHLDLSAAEWEALTRGRAGLDPAEALLRRLTGVLSAWEGALVVHGVRRVSPAFDARFGALWRDYEYRISDGLSTRDPLTRQGTHWHQAGVDVRLMQVEADTLTGLHDFLSFCRPREGATTVRQVLAADVERGADGLVRVRLRADAFCHSMVRSIVGALLQVGEGRRPPGWVAARLATPARDSEVRLAPARGLTLMAVGYPEDEASLRRRAEGTRARRAPLR